MFRIVSSSAIHLNQGKFTNGEDRVFHKYTQCYSKKWVKQTPCESPNQVKKIMCHGKGDCPPLPKFYPPPKGPSTGLGLTIIALILITGGVICQAKRDPEFREKLVEYFPISDEIIKVVFKEEKSYEESFHQYIDSLKEE